MVEGGEFDCLAVTPRAARVPAFAGMTDEFGLVQPDDGLGQGVVVEPAPRLTACRSRLRVP